MKSNYSKLGDFITESKFKNKDSVETNLVGLSNEKKFTESRANIIGSDLSKYKLIQYNQFVYTPTTSRNGDKISIALFKENGGIISSSYTVFDVNSTLLNPDYLMLWFDRPEFDRYARYHSHGSVREIFSWEDLQNIELFVPPLEHQEKIVKIKNLIENRISILSNINKKLYDFSQKIYEKWFIQFEFPISDNETYNSSGGKFKNIDGEEIPINMKILSIGDICDCQNGHAFYKKGYDEEGMMVIDLGNIDLQGNFIYTSSDKHVNPEKVSEKFLVKKDDLIMVMTDRKETMDLLGKTAKIFENKEYALNQRVYRLRSSINVNYVYSFLNSEKTLNILKSQALGSVQKYINTDHIKNLKVLVPDNELMEEYSQIVDPLFFQMENNTLEIKEMIILRDVLIPKLMSGEIDVSEINCD